jgi:ketosteroid isomerase-like protein
MSLSPQDRKAVRAFTRAFNAGDVDGVIALCDAQVEFRSKFAAPGGAVYRGHDGVRQWHRDLMETWGDEFSVDLEALFDVGAHILVFTLLHGRGQQSGVDVELPAAMVVRLRDGRLVTFRGYSHRDDALKDLDVALQALEPISP